MNLPNKLSIFRIILVPVITAIFLFPYAQFGIAINIYKIGDVSLSLVDIIVLILFIVASLTDALDGHLARSRNLITSFGKFIDPIADKLLVNTLFILLAYRGTLLLIPVIIMIWRDTMVDGMRMMAGKGGVVVAAQMSGKLKTVFQMITIIVALLANLPFALIGIPMVDILLWASCIISVYSGIQYFQQTSAYILESK